MRFRPWKKKRGPETPERQPNDAEADGGCQKRCGPSPKTRYCAFCVGIGADRPGLVARETPAVLMSILAHHRRSGRVAFEWQPSLSSSCPLTVRTPHSLKNTQTLVLQTNRIPMVSTQNSTTHLNGHKTCWVQRDKPEHHSQTQFMTSVTRVSSVWSTGIANVNFLREQLKMFDGYINWKSIIPWVNEISYHFIIIIITSDIFPQNARIRYEVIRHCRNVTDVFL